MVENEKTAIEFLRSSRYTIVDVLVLQEWADRHADVLRNHAHHLRVIPDRVMAQVSHYQSHSPLFVVVELPERVAVPSELLGYTIYLDRVQDPGNVGTIIRIADWFGIERVVRSPESADFYNPKTVQSTMGSMVAVDLYTAPFGALPSGLPVYGALLDGEALGGVAWARDGILVVGNESRGISKSLQGMVTDRVFIPGSEGRVAESLNAAMATGIICGRIFERKMG